MSCTTNVVDLQFQAKQAHWNVKGPSFIGLHKLFDKIDKAELRQNVAAWVATLALVANYDGELKPEAAR